MYLIETMLLEALVVGMCVSGYECNKAPQAYYLQNKDLQTLVKESERKAKSIAGPIVVGYVIPVLMPFVALSTGQTAKVNITKHWALEGNSKESRIVLGWTW